MGSPAPLLERSSCATWGTESPGSAWGISTPKAEREFELNHNLPSGSWAGRGGSDHSPDPAGCAYDPPSKRAANEGDADTFELACAPCTGCGLDEPFARDLDSGDPYCKDCWCAKGHIVETIGISSRCKARIKLCFTTANVHNPCLFRYAHEQGLEDASIFASENNPDGRLRSTAARTKRIDEVFTQKLKAEEQSGLRASDAAKAIGPETPVGGARPIARLKKRGRIDTLMVDLLSGSPRTRKQRAEELAESCESREELRRHGEKVSAMKKRGGVLSRNDRGVLRLVRLLL
jgi:hypothetical protein